MPRESNSAPYQFEDHSLTIPTYRKQEEEGKTVVDEKRTRSLGQ